MVLRELLVLMDPSALQESRALRGSEERTELLDIKERRDPQVHQAPLERRLTPAKTVLRSEKVQTMQILINKS